MGQSPRDKDPPENTGDPMQEEKSVNSHTITPYNLNKRRQRRINSATMP